MGMLCEPSPVGSPALTALWVSVRVKNTGRIPERDELKVLFTQPCPTLCATLCVVARQAPGSMGFPRQEYWSGLSFLPQGDLPDPGIKPGSYVLRQILYRFETSREGHHPSFQQMFSEHQLGPRRSARERKDERGLSLPLGS